MGEAQVQKSRMNAVKALWELLPQSYLIQYGPDFHRNYSPAEQVQPYKLPHIYACLFFFKIQRCTHTYGVREEVINDQGHNYALAVMMMVGGRGYFMACQVTAAPHRHPCHVYIRPGQMTKLRRREKCQRRFMFRRWRGPWLVSGAAFSRPLDTFLC